MIFSVTSERFIQLLIVDQLNCEERCNPPPPLKSPPSPPLNTTTMKVKSSNVFHWSLLRGFSAYARINTSL